MTKHNILFIVLDTHKVSSEVAYIRAISREIVLPVIDVKLRIARVPA